MKLPLFRFLFRKMWNTRWLTLTTLIGLIIAVAFATSIPMYADGALKRVVSETLKVESEGLPAGSLLMSYQATEGKTDPAQLKQVSQYIQEDVPGQIDFPFSTFAQSWKVRATEVHPDDPTKVDPSRTRTFSLATMSGLDENAELMQGEWPKDRLGPNDTVEVAIMEEAMYRNDLHIGDVLIYPIYGGLNLNLRVQIVGAYKALDETSAYWYSGLDAVMGTLVVNQQVFEQDLMGKMNIPVHSANWYYAFDLSEIQSSQISPLGSTLERLNIELYQILKDTRIDISFQSLLDQFRVQSVQLQIMLFTLAAPMLAMVFFFIVINARQSLEKQRSDIAVLRSRGAFTKQIVMMYLFEGLILGVVALIIGPAIGWFMAKSIGSANGFLEFVNRKSIPVGFSLDTVYAGLAAVILAVAAMVIPAIMFARSSIVDYKKELARSDRKPFWQRWFLDILLLAVAGYGWYLFNERQMISMTSSMTTDQLNVQPFLFFVPAIAIFALGLFFLRLFPLILKFFNWLGRKFLPVPIYLTLMQLGRSSKGYYPLMILLILTLGLGVYDASAARTIDLNSTERTLYEYGTDVVVKTVWEGQAELQKPQQGAGGGGQQKPGQGGRPGQGGAGGQGGGSQAPVKINLIEPPFEVFKELDGVEAAARVLQTKGNVVVSGRSIGQGTLMGIDNDDFAKVAWFRNDLYQTHPFNYLNYLGLAEHAAIIPTNIAERYQLKVGDTVSVSLTDGMIDFAIVGIVPYWPAQYPDQSPFIIANLDYIYDQVPMMQYDVWLKMQPDAKVAPIIETLQQKDILLASVADVRQELIAQSKQPTRGGVFGILSLGFFVSVIVSLVGYLLYWFFNLSGRTVQFGVLRAMGLSRKQLTGMLLLEQIFTAGLSIGLGILIGKISSKLFLPFLQTSENVTNAVPPFRVIFNSSDTNQLYVVVLVMIILGGTFLATYIRRLKVGQAVKMGEEQ